MSLQSLVSGSECALPNNPLAQVLKHTDSDHSVQRDRAVGPSSSRLNHLPLSTTGYASEQDARLARQFFEGNAMQRPGQFSTSQSHMELLQHTASSQKVVQPSHQPASDSGLQRMWLQNKGQSGLDGSLALSSAWRTEFGNNVNDSQHTSFPQQLGSSQNYERLQNAPYNTSTTAFPSMQLGGGFSSMPFNATQSLLYPSTQMADKGKGKAREEAFDAIFAEYASNLQIQGSNKQDATREGVSSIIESLEQSTINGNEEETEFNDVLQAWSNLQGSSSSEDIQKLEAEFQQVLRANKENIDFDYDASIREAWGNDLSSFSEAYEEGMKFDDEGVPQLPPYPFVTENKHLQSADSTSCLERAKHLLHNDGSLTEAALLLEAAIQKGDLGEGGYEAWVLLGETRCMDEREGDGMSALLEGIRRADAAGAKGQGMLSLASAFTNEGYERGSHAMLLRWLASRFPEHTPPPETFESLKQSHWASRDKVRDAFLSVARAQHTAGVVDADVQSGLGILFYTDGDFERARDCFNAALTVRPNDYLLWNRMGSALSNGDKPEEALGAYREALRLRPSYTRAVYNVGVACLNIGANKEAAEHILSALSLQESPAGTKSSQLWFTLRRVFTSMGRDDLASKATLGADIATFRAEGFDF